MRGGFHILLSMCCDVTKRARMQRLKSALGRTAEISSEKKPPGDAATAGRSDREALRGHCNERGVCAQRRRARRLQIFARAKPMANVRP